MFEQGIPERMLEGVGELDLVGIGVLPGPMRKLLGVSKPFVRPRDFAGQVVGLQDSAVADKTLRALGATPRLVPSRRSSTASTPTSSSSGRSRETPTTGARST